MGNYTPDQVYERVLLHQQKADQVIFTGKFMSPAHNVAGLLIELRIVQPPEAVASTSALTSAGFPSIDEPGIVRLVVPQWADKLCGVKIVYEVRGLDGGNFTPWESFETVITARNDTRKWVRKTDGDMHVLPIERQPVRRWYPATLDELIWCVRTLHENTGADSESHTTASHWAISNASATHGAMFETATPVHENGSDQLAGRLNNVLYEVVPDCLTEGAKRFFKGQSGVNFQPGAVADDTKYYLFHAEAGTRVHELYSYIDGFGEDVGTEARKRSLARNVEVALATDGFSPPYSPEYYGPWALETMGGAGGQTIVGVASTATHGGDINWSAIGELVVALHLIAPDGQEYWIERTRLSPAIDSFQLVDPTLLKQAYRVGDPSFPGGTQRRKEIIYKRDDTLMNAVLVSCGRMGVIYSVVLRVVRQYGLDQVTKTDTWKETKKWIANPADPTNVNIFTTKRFLRIDVDLYPGPDFDWGDAAIAFAAFVVGGGPASLVVGFLFGLQGDEYRTWHITRSKVKLNDTLRPDDNGQLYFYGRNERAGAAAGIGVPLDIDPAKGCFRNPCRSGNYIHQLLTDMIGVLTDIRDTAVDAWLAAGVAMLLTPLSAPVAIAAQAVAAATIVFAEGWIVLISGVRAILPDTASFGDFLCGTMNTLGDLHATVLIQILYCAAQETEHKATDKALVAIGYGVMDEHDYQNKGCIFPGDSIELFFDATTPDFVNFVDYVIDQVRDLAGDGKMWAGYLSMRFMTDSPSLLATQRWKRTVSMEIASLSKVSGAVELMDRIDAEALTRGIILHWGQRNNRLQADIESTFLMSKWRQALSDLSAHGRLANLSTEFTKKKGLEITNPMLYGLKASIMEGCPDETTIVSYDAFDNPPETRLMLVRRFLDGTGWSMWLPELKGTIPIQMSQGQSELELRAVRQLNENEYTATPLSLTLRGFGTGDFWEWRPETEMRFVDGVIRWFAELTLYSNSISNKLKVSEVQLSATSGSGWILRKPPLPDVPFAGMVDTKSLPSQPVFNTTWQFFSAGAATGIFGPTLIIRFKMVC